MTLDEQRATLARDCLSQAREATDAETRSLWLKRAELALSRIEEESAESRALREDLAHLSSKEG